MRFTITGKHHEYLKLELPRIAALFKQAYQKHAETGGQPCDRIQFLNGKFGPLASELEVHLHKEEMILFPMIVSGNTDFVRMPIQVMLQEHDDHAEALRRTRALSADLVAPEEACTTWRALYRGLAQLERDLMDHIHLENNVLFPMVLNG